MNIVKTSSAVRIASMKTPLAKLVSAESVVLTLSCVGNMTETRKLAKILPEICATNSKKNLTGDMAFVNNIANVTAGLNRPPEMRKNIHTLTMREKAKTRAIYCSTGGENPVSAPVVVLLSEVSWVPMLATCVPEKAKKRNMVVPTNSPIKETKSIQELVSGVGPVHWAGGRGYRQYQIQWR